MYMGHFYRNNFYNMTSIEQKNSHYYDASCTNYVYSTSNGLGKYKCFRLYLKFKQHLIDLKIIRFEIP